MERYYSLNLWLREQYGEKIYKLALDGGMTCPNRDGTIGKGGCIFCSEGGSGEFAVSAPSVCSQSTGELTQVASSCSQISNTIVHQIEEAKKKIQNKSKAKKFIAYFQSYTNTYAPVEKLRVLFTQALEHPDIVALSIATRPDCLPTEVLDLLAELNQIKPVWVELGLQTIHPQTAAYIRRGYALECYDRAVQSLKERNIIVITHVILGLPEESRQQMLQTVDYVGKSGSDGIKLQLLHVLKGTDLEKEYEQGKFEVMTMEEYLDILFEAIEILPKNIVIHRLTGDGPKSLLIAPQWTANKRMVMNTIRREMKERDIQQGKKFSPSFTM
jgi:hypothetical protein